MDSQNPLPLPLMELPNEILEIIVRHLANIAPTWAILFGATCRRAHHITQRMLRDVPHPALDINLLGQYPSTLQWAAAQPGCPQKMLLAFAGELGCAATLDVLLQLAQEGAIYPVWDETFLEDAATSGHSQVAAWYTEHAGRDITEIDIKDLRSCTSYAAGEDRVEFLRALPLEVVKAHAAWMFTSACQNSAVRTMEWIVQNLDLKWGAKEVQSACRGSNAGGALKWMHQRQPKAFAGVMKLIESSCRYGDLSAIQWFYELYGFRVFNPVTGVIAESCKLDVLKWARSCNLYLPLDKCRMSAACGGHIHVLDWLEEIKPIDDPQRYFGWNTSFSTKTADWVMAQFGIAAPFQDMLDRVLDQYWYHASDVGQIKWALSRASEHSVDLVVDWHKIATHQCTSSEFLQWRHDNLPEALQNLVSLSPTNILKSKYENMPALRWLLGHGVVIPIDWLEEYRAYIVRWGDRRDLEIAAREYSLDPTEEELHCLVRYGRGEIARWLIERYPQPVEVLVSLANGAANNYVLGFERYIRAKIAADEGAASD